MANPFAEYVNLNTILVFIVYSLNFLMLVGALVMIYICLSESRQKDLMENMDMSFEFLSFFARVVLIIAVVVILVSFLGCVGIGIDNDYMLIAHVIMIGVLMVAQIFLTSYLTHKVMGDSEEDVRKKIIEDIKEYTRQDYRKMDGFQSKYSCCGIDDYTDYLKNGSIGYIPGSCCQKRLTEHCSIDLVIGKRGCKNAIMDEIANILRGSYVVMFIIFAIEVVLAICTVLVILDIGQPEDDGSTDEIVMVASIKKRLPRTDSKFEESIDTHDSHSIRSPLGKEDEISGLYDEEKTIQKSTKRKFQKKSRRIKNITKDGNDEEIPAHEENVEEFLEDETIEAENVARKTHDEEIYLEGNLDENSPESKKVKKQYVRKRNINTRKKSDSQKNLEDNDDEDNEEEEEEDEEEESPVTANETKSEENIQVLKSKRSDRKKYGEKVRKERNRDRKRYLF